MDEKLIPISDLDDLPAHALGHDILRYISMPNFLGLDRDSLLYFIGRNLSRQLDIKNMNDIVYLFNKFQWGNLDNVKGEDNNMIFHLMSDEVAARILSPFQVDYRLEAGFLAESVERIVEKSCECTETINKRLYRVEFKLTVID